MNKWRNEMLRKHKMYSFSYEVYKFNHLNFYDEDYSQLKLHWIALIHLPVFYVCVCLCKNANLLCLSKFVHRKWEFCCRTTSYKCAQQTNKSRCTIERYNKFSNKKINVVNFAKIIKLLKY